MALTAGTRMGPYELVSLLGAGGMGEVYRARDSRLGRDVAIKVLPPQFAADQVALARFEREARAVAALSHPNILAIFDLGQQDGLTYAVTELLEGESLRQRLSSGALPVRKALECASQIAAGLAAAHEKGIVHRDLKPENLFLLPDGRVKILDFGLARQAAPTGPADPNDDTAMVVTHPGMVAGTPAYMAPEQVRGQAPTPQVDIFAFGSVLFEMLTGQRAFRGHTHPEVMTAVLREEPPAVSAVDPRLPAPLTAIVRRCLEKEPGERFQSARDLAFQLQMMAGASTPGGSQPAVAGIEPATGTSATASPGAVPPPRSRWIRVGLPVAAALVVGLTAFGGGWFVRSRETASAPSFLRASYTQKAIFRAAFATERNTIVYSAALDGNRPQLFVLSPEYPSAKALDIADAHLLAISAKGEVALLTRARVVGQEVLQGTLARMPLSAAKPRESLENVRDADWSPDGSELAILRTEDGKDRLEWPAGRMLYQTDGYLGDVRIAPGGDRVALVDHPLKWEGRGSVILVDRAGGRTTLAGEYPFVKGLAWRPDGQEVVFSASTSGAGNTAIYSVTPEGRTRLVLEGAGSLTIQDISPDGRWLVTRDDRRVGVRALAPGATSERELTWLDRSNLAALASDGRAVLFTELAPPAGPAGSVCLRSTDGTPPLTLGAGDAQDLSPDGRFALAIVSSPPRLVVYPTGTGEERTLPGGSIAEYRRASWFADGTRILVCGTESGKGSRCYVQDLGGGPPRRVTDSGERGLASPDGERILVWRAGSTAAIWRLAGGPAAPIPSLTDEDVPVRWSPDGRSIIVFRSRQIPGQLERVDLLSGRREAIRPIWPEDRAGVLSVDAVSVTPDLASYAYTYNRLLSTLFVVAGVR